MARYIDADKFLIEENEGFECAQGKVSDKINRDINTVVHLKIQRLIKDAPTEDVRPEKYGKWIFREPDTWECWLCGKLGGMSRYCSNCGAKMDGDGKDTK